jgi:hypothetical protein
MLHLLTLLGIQQPQSSLRTDWDVPAKVSFCAVQIILWRASVRCGSQYLVQAALRDLIPICKDGENMNGEKTEESSLSRTRFANIFFSKRHPKPRLVAFSWVVQFKKYLLDLTTHYSMNATSTKNDNRITKLQNTRTCIVATFLVLVQVLMVTFLGAFAKFLKATISFVMSDRLSLRSSVRLSAWNNSAPTRRIFMKFYIWGFFENMLRKYKFH